MSNHKIVYSTDDSLVTENQETTVDNSINIDQNIRLHLDRKKGGKIATVIRGFDQTDDRLKNLAKRIKRQCATGGSIKNNEIIIQVNKRDIVKTILEEASSPKNTVQNPSIKKLSNNFLKKIFGQALVKKYKPFKTSKNVKFQKIRAISLFVLAENPFSLSMSK